MRAHAASHLRMKSYNVYTDESRQTYSIENEKAVLNACIELPIKLKWDTELMMEALNGNHPARIYQENIIK